jgi:amidase
MRPTHARIAVNGCFTLAHSFDTVAWFARSGTLIAEVFGVLAHSRVPASRPDVRFIAAGDVSALLDPAIASAFVLTLAALEKESHVTRMPVGVLKLDAWAKAFRTLQAAEVWQQHGRWVNSCKPSMGKDIGQRFDAAEKVDASAVGQAQHARCEAMSVLAQLLGPGQLLLMPTVPTVAPDKQLEGMAVNDIRMRSQQLLCIAGLAGLPQVTMPWVLIDGAPVGLSLIGARGQDEFVLSAAIHLEAALVTLIKPIPSLFERAPCFKL